MSIDGRKIEIFNYFADGIQQYWNTNELPKEGNQDLQFFLKLRKQRLDKHGLTYNYKLKEWFSRSIIKAALQPQYNNSLYARPYEEVVTIKNNKKTIYRKKRKINFYEVIYDGEQNNNSLNNVPYQCPNCGAVSKVDTLRNEGCPYCKTQFKISELFPKVINYYTLSNPSVDANRLKKIVMILSIICYIVCLILCLQKNMASEDFPKIVMFIFSWIHALILTGMVVFGGYILWGMYKLAQMFVMAIGSIALVVDDQVAKKAILNTLNKYDPYFTYEFFEGQIAATIKNIIFSDNQTKYPLYKGNHIEKLDNIVDSEYILIKSFKLIQVTDEEIMIKLKVKLNNLYYINGTIKKVTEDIGLTLKHSRCFESKDNFSIFAINCANCGGSFDITKDDHCPYCHKDNSNHSNNWIVISIDI